MSKQPIHVDDMVGTPVSDGSWYITLGGSLDMVLGRVFEVGNSWWGSFRYHGITDEHGNYYGETAPPELIAMSRTLEEAIRAYGARKNPPQHDAETGSP